MERRIYEAAVEGNVISLLKLLQEDVLLLDRFMVGCYVETPLHVASMLGHVEFVQEILNQKPELAGQLDAWKSSALHLATAKGYLDIVKILVSVNPDMCFAHDRDGRNPLHIAAIKGHINVLRELVKLRPHAARIISFMDRGETILHLCVRYNQLETLKLLVEKMGDRGFVNSKDDNGNTILHVTVLNKQVEVIKFLTTSSTIQVNALNARGLTALDILTKNNRNIEDSEIGELLRGCGARSGKTNIHPLAHDASTLTSLENHHNSMILQSQAGNGLGNYGKGHDDWFEKMRSALMVVASLIATIAFQVGVNPPGGVWQETSLPGAPTSDILEVHWAGFSIMADHCPSRFNVLLASNTTGFIASLSIILLLISGLPFKCRFFMWILMVIMWIAVSAMAFTYLLSVYSLTINKALSAAAPAIMFIWIGLMTLLLLGHTIRFIVFRRQRNIQSQLA